PDVVRMLVEWLYSEQVMTAVGPRCQPLKYAPLEGEYCPYQGTSAVWAVLDWITAEGLLNQGLAPLFHDLALERMVAGMDRTGSAIECWPVHRKTGAVCYRPHLSTTMEGASLTMACAEIGQQNQAWSISSGHAALMAQAAGYDMPGRAGWERELCERALIVAREIPPAAVNRPETSIYIDLKRGKRLKKQRARKIGLVA
ncbi:MAG TPA: hypothetical protein VMR98_04290, partial [Candidatus Polarisedimenticolaceae bacterium]|nr:hypothetical protein [Candidatus Polarisedimenticolaceae bacterium]